MATYNSCRRTREGRRGQEWKLFFSFSPLPYFFFSPLPPSLLCSFFFNRLVGWWREGEEEEEIRREVEGKAFRNPGEEG